MELLTQSHLLWDTSTTKCKHLRRCVHDGPNLRPIMPQHALLPLVSGGPRSGPAKNHDIARTYMFWHPPSKSL